MKTHLKGSVLKNLPAGLSASASDGMWGAATVEIKDIVDDVVRVKGIGWETYHNPPDSHLKILAGHLKATNTGEPTVIGRVEELVKGNVETKGAAGSSPALLFRMSWAKDGNGTITELAKKYKDLYDGGYLDSFSIGFLAKEYNPFKGGGYDITQSELFEISAVSIPANSGATRIRAIQEKLGPHMDPETLALIEVKALLSEQSDRFGQEIKSLKELLDSRMDDLEALLIASAKESETPSDPQESDNLKTLKQISEALSHVKIGSSK